MLKFFLNIFKKNKEKSLVKIEPALEQKAITEPVEPVITEPLVVQDEIKIDKKTPKKSDLKQTKPKINKKK